MIKLIGAVICAAIITELASAHAQQVNCTPAVQGEREFLGPLLVSALVPALVTIAGHGLNYLTKKISAPVPGIEFPSGVGSSDAPACVDRTQPRTGLTSAGIVYTLYRVDAQRAVAIATSNDTYKSGDGVALTVTNNVPGILDVWNINGAGTRTKIDTVKLESLGTVVLPHQVQGYYRFDNMDGDEILKLAFSPCVGHAEDLTPVSDPKVFAQMATLAQLRPEVATAFPSCLPATERVAALGTYEDLVHTPNAAVASIVAVKPLAVPTSGSAKFTPIIVTLRLRRG